MIPLMKLAFVGHPAVGKDAVANYVEQTYGLKHVSSGDIIRAYVTENNLGDLSRENLGIQGNILRKEKGGDILVKIALEKNPNDLILSGLRTVDEVETFKKAGGKIVAVTAPLEKRFEWAKTRGRIDDNTSFEDFKKIEDKERANAERTSQNVEQVIAMRDMEIVNDGTLEDLFKKVDQIEGLRK